MNILLTVLGDECPSNLTSVLEEIARNPARAMAIEKDAHRFVRQNCKWVQPPCPPTLVAIMQDRGLSMGPIGIIASYAYEPVERQVKDIFGQITSDDQTVLPPIVRRFNQLVNRATCFIPERMTNMNLQDKILSLCMFANERLHIATDEKKMRGTILCLGQLALRHHANGDCCSWASVAGRNSDIVTGESSNNLRTCSIAMRFLTDMTESMPDDIKDSIATGKPLGGKDDNDDEVKKDSAFDRLLTLALLDEMAQSRREVLVHITWIKDNFKSMAEIQDMMNELETACIEEKKMYLRSLRLFIRHKIMEAMYESERHPLFPVLKCALCDREAFMTCPCKTVRYCSRECQSADWRRHKKTCKRLDL
jgi:hypothetical protein